MFGSIFGQPQGCKKAKTPIELQRTMGGASPNLLTFFAEIRTQPTDNYIKSFKNSAELKATVLKDLWNYVLYSLQVQNRMSDVSSSVISEIGKDALVEEKIREISTRLEASFQETTSRLGEELEARTSELRHLKGKAEEREARIADLQAKLEELQGKLSEVEASRAITEAALERARKDVRARKGLELLRDVFMTEKQKRSTLYRTLFDLQLKSLLRESESRVIGALRTLNTAAVTYAATYPDRGFPRALDEMGPSGAGLIDSELAKGSLHGYRFEYAPLKQRASSAIGDYEIRATPASFVTLGLRSFYSDSSAVIRYTKEARAAGPNDPPL